MSLDDFRKMLVDGYEAFNKAKNDVLGPIQQARQGAQMALNTVNDVSASDADDFSQISTLNSQIDTSNVPTD